jgi:hypothetical protein
MLEAHHRGLKTKLLTGIERWIVIKSYHISSLITDD